MSGPRRLLTGLLAAGVVAALAAPVPAAAAGTGSEAIGAPGALSHFDQSRKDCLGTARNTTSKIWYTVADGVLSDVYAPTEDTTNVQTMQYLVTDGSTFTDLQQRDTTYTVAADPTGMLCTVTSTAKSGAYQLITQYLTDPARDSVILHTRYLPKTAAAKKYHLYVRLDATAAGNGGGGADNTSSGAASGNGGADTAVTDHSTGHPVPVTYDTKTQTNAAGRDYAVPTYLALRADRPFTKVSSGFAGTDSDGLSTLDSTHTLSPAYSTATDGNVEQTAGLQTDAGGELTMALGFGTTQRAAVTTAGRSAATPVIRMATTYVGQWLHYDLGLRRPAAHLPGLNHAQQLAAQRVYYTSANAVKATEDKTFPGAIGASLTSPWGQAVSAGDPAQTYFGSYREIFARDLYEAFTALLTDGDLATARDTTRFLLLRQQQDDGSMPRNSLLNGAIAPDSFNNQLDETAYPILMVSQSGLSYSNTLWPHVRAAANFLVAHGPSYGVERWEEQSGYSPSTIAAEIAGLVAAGRIARLHHDNNASRVYLATADEYQRSIKGWTVTTNGPLSSKPYFIRLSKTGDPNAAITYNLGNGGPDADQRSVMDAGFLELVRLGELPANDTDVQNSLPVVDSTLEHQTPNGPGWLRYNGDGYGDCHVGSGTSCTVEGAPWAGTNTGTGHIWPVLSGERAEQELATGQRADAGSLLAAIDAQAAGVGLVPEQVWDYPDLARSPYRSDPATASIGFTDGLPAGSAGPLTWGAAAQVRLVADLTAGRVLEKPSNTLDRYVRHHQAGTALTVTSPADNSAAGSTVVVAGTAAPAATIDIADVATDTNDSTDLATVQVDRHGKFTATITPQAGTNVLVITSTARGGGTAQAVRTVVNDVVDGTLLLDQSDPTGDDNGPGNYAYPNAGDFHAGAFDLTDFQVYDTGSTVTFRARTADLTPTFGSPLGAQLLDVYVHTPDGAATSTQPSYASQNYTVADPWNRLVEVEGFGQKYVDAKGSPLGTISLRANQISRWITFSVDKSALGGTPGAGWAFTVALTGQDGTHGSDLTRTFTATPTDYTFGVCASDDASAFCSADPNTVPKAMDVLTPSGTSQSDELDYTAHDPVTLAAIPVD